MIKNEIQFLSWEEFQQMAPSILTLEVTRLAGLIRETGALDIRNPLAKARVELKRFIACVQHVNKEEMEQTCSPHLLSAIIGVSLAGENMEQPTLNYVLDRLRYVQERIPYIY